MKAKLLMISASILILLTGNNYSSHDAIAIELDTDTYVLAKKYELR